MGKSKLSSNPVLWWEVPKATKKDLRIPQFSRDGKCMKYITFRRPKLYLQYTYQPTKEN
jgi:hypothetical protein